MSEDKKNKQLRMAKGQMVRFAKKYPDTDFDKLLEMYPHIGKHLEEQGDFNWLRDEHSNLIQQLQDGTYQSTYRPSKNKKGSPSQEHQEPQQVQDQPQQEPSISQEQVNTAVEKCLSEGKCGPFNDIMSQLDNVQKSLYNIPQTLQGAVSNDVEHLLDDIAGRLKNIENRDDVSDLKNEILSRTAQYAHSQSASEDQPEPKKDDNTQSDSQPVHSERPEEEQPADEAQLLQKVISGLSNLETMLESTFKEENAGKDQGQSDEGNKEDIKSNPDESQSEISDRKGVIGYDPRPDVFGG